MAETKTTEAQLRASKTYQAKLDTITLRIPKEDGERIRSEAKAAGLSITQYVMKKINNKNK